MTKYKWLRLKEFDNALKIRGNEGDNFLFGAKVIDQKNIKKIGDRITYFTILKSSNRGKNIEYIQAFDVLEEDKIDERN